METLKLRFYYQPILQIATIAFFALGGIWMFAGAALIYGVTIFVDGCFGDYTQDESASPHSDLPLHLTSILIFGLVGFYVCLVGVSFPEAGGLAAWSEAAAEAFFKPQPLWALAGGTLCIGMHVAAAAGNVGHEYSHRTGSPLIMQLAQWLFALALHTSFPIEHVVGHHRNVGTDGDPTTARRGEGFWSFAPRSVLGTYRNAFRFEANRCQRIGLSAYSLKNRAIAGYFKQCVVCAIAFALGGVAGLIGFLISALIALVIIEQFNYVAHYGLVRLPGEPIRADHSWSWSLLGSSSLMFNLTRHSAHHLTGSKRYWELPHIPGGPTYPYGPFVTVMVALCPPLFRALAARELSRWDRTLASNSERALLTGKRTRNGTGTGSWRQA